MKKIIALAVASAFVAPAFAAEVSISGSFEYALVSEKQDAAGTNQDIEGQEASFVVSATEELANGLTVSASMNIESDGGEGGGSNVTVKGNFGTISLGDTSGGIDGIDDKADPFTVYDNGSSLGTSADADVAWTLPALADGLSVRVGYAQADSGNTTNSLVSAQDSNGGGTAKLVDLGVTYSVIDGLTVGYGRGAAGKLNLELVNAVYTLNNVRFAYEVSSTDDKSIAGTANKDKATMMALTYAMNDMTFKYATNKTEDESAGTDTSDVSAMGVSYSLGAASLFIEQAEDGLAGSNKDDMTAVGITFSF